ncbi:MAG: class I adenylate-forming enzyme family protein [Bacteroidales bacterium]
MTSFFDYLFEHTATSQALLVKGNREKATFGEVYSRSVALSGAIPSLSGEQKQVLLVSDNSVFFIVAYLAVIRSGYTVVPVNPQLEEETMNYILDETGASLVFADSRAARKFPFDGLKVITPENAEDVSTGQQADFIINPDDVAEIIYTSGSTGKPKGVMLTHRNLIANTTSILGYLDLTERDTVLVVMPFHYCYGLSLLHTHIRVGGSVVLNNSFLFLGSVLRDLNNYECTGFSGVPSHFQVLLRKTAFKETPFPSLRYMTQAGGRLHEAFIREIREAMPEVKFYVMYGQTEATARLSYMPPEMLDKKTGSIGKGIPGVELRVVNSEGREVAPGEEGEIIARGDNIMAGYFKSPDLTAESLRDGWLHTGDLAKVDEDGFIYVTGRLKEMIKVRGRRISPKEIEAVIVALPGVVDCSVRAYEDDLEGEAIEAEVVLSDPDAGPDEDEIRRACAQKLESYKVPSRIHLTGQMKVSSSGKKKL